jgi:hypothetical protein
MLFWALLASGQITLRRVDGWDTLHVAPTDEPGQSHMEFTVVEGWLHLLGEWRYQLGSRVPERRGTRVSAFFCS